MTVPERIEPITTESSKREKEANLGKRMKLRGKCRNRSPQKALTIGLKIYDNGMRGDKNMMIRKNNSIEKKIIKGR